MSHHGYQWHVPWHRRHRREEGEEEEESPPDLNPVLLIPGIGGSILNAVTSKGSKERIWVRLFLADKEFRSKLWSIFQPETGKTVSLDPDSHIEVPQDKDGLYAVDVLDPDITVSADLTGYYHSMIVEMRKWGYKDGETLFGFGYDFRQSNRLPDHMAMLLEKLRHIKKKSGKKVDVITHSMGGLLFKSFVSLHYDDVAELVDKWITIASPFQGAPGFIMDTLLTGVEFVRGWESSLFVTKWSMHQLLVECPSVYELLANYSFPWERPPELRVVQACDDPTGGSCKKETFASLESVLETMEKALKDNSVTVNGKAIPLPLNQDIVNLAAETRQLWRATKLPESVLFFNIYGVALDTPYHSQYGSEEAPLSKLSDILNTNALFDCVDGDGTVPVESSSADGFTAKFRIGVPGEHRGLLSDGRVHRILGYFLKVPPHDSLYDPCTDFVLLPKKEEIEAEMEAAKRKQQCVPLLLKGGQEGCLVMEDKDHDMVEVSFMPEKA